jgi:hypothetical protein
MKFAGEWVGEGSLRPHALAVTVASDMVDIPRKTPRQPRSRGDGGHVAESGRADVLREALVATTNRIAEHAGISIGMLYQYFPNKHALLRALVERHMAEAGARVGSRFAALRTSFGIDPPSTRGSGTGSART